MAIKIKSPEQIEIIRQNAALLAATLAEVIKEVKPGGNGLNLDKLAETYIRDHGGVPSFKGLYGCPSSILISVNEDVVHGIPNARAYKDGDLQALCDYWRYHGISPGVGINHAAEGGYFGATPVPTANILADAIRCDWVALDPYLFTASVPYFNSGNSTINQTSINNTIAGLIAWTQGWIDRLAPYGIPVVLITQGIRELGMPQSYVDQYLEVQYSTFGIQQTPLRLVFPYEVLIGLEVYTLLNVDVSGHVNAHPFAKTNQHFPKLTSARPRQGQLYPRNTFKY